MSITIMAHVPRVGKRNSLRQIKHPWKRGCNQRNGRLSRHVQAPCSMKGSSRIPSPRGVGGSDQGMRGLCREKPQACVPLEGAEVVCRAPESLEEGACGGMEGAPWGLGCVPYQNPTRTRFSNGGICYKDARKARSRHNLKAGSWSDWRKEPTGARPGKPSCPFCSLLSTCPLPFSLFFSPAPRP